jgi:hypothetical protein
MESAENVKTFLSEFLDSHSKIAKERYVSDEDSREENKAKANEAAY